jgi:uncharacterized protein YndB with AHSA1/START domain
MARTGSVAPSAADRELVVTRVFDAPRDLVWKVWSDPAHLVHWWGPRDFTTPSLAVDFRAGGGYRACIRSPEGRDYWMRGSYWEIEAPERLVFTFAWEEPEGQPGHETLVTVGLTEEGPKTRLTFYQALFESVGQRNAHQEGWAECLDLLEQYLRSLPGDGAANA